MRNANTEASFQGALAILRRSSPLAAHYFDTKVDHDHTYQYRLNALKIATHGFKTSQIVECVNGVFVKARHFTPYRMNNMILNWIGEQYAARLQEITKWIAKGHVLTPYAAGLFKIEVSVGPKAWAPRVSQCWARAQGLF